MAASTVPAAKAAILTMIRAIPDLNAASISWAGPTETEDLVDEMVFFEGNRPAARVAGPRDPSAAGRDVHAHAEAVRNRSYDDDAQSAEQRTWAIVALIETAIRSDLRLGGLLRGLEFDEQEITTVPLGDGWYGEATVPIICTARS
jgi:hypothetical protein